MAKQVADLITWTRAAFSVLLAWMGIAFGSDALPVVVFIMIADWIGDMLDGPIARHSRKYYNTWIGDHDIQIDILVSVGLGFYLLESGYITIWVVLIYTAIWLVIYKIFGMVRSLGMLFQAPIYGWFIYVALRENPYYGRWIIIFLAGVIIFTWPRFPRMVVPGFLSGMRQVIGQIKHDDD